MGMISRTNQASGNRTEQAGDGNRISEDSMTWQELRIQYPQCWVLVEALDAFTQDGQRVIPSLKFLGDYGADWNQAWEAYKRLHHADKFREYYVLHTERETLDIGVIDAYGHKV
jgi:hypothetical protein